MNAQKAAVPRRVLVVDDSREVADATVRILKSMGHEALPVYDGTAAMSQAVSFQPDFVLIDLVMPGMDGLELVRELRNMFPDRAPKMVALTAFAQPAFRDAAQWAGFDAYLNKPATLAELQRLLSS
jgi:CheY-like chemotaxis protein